MYNFVQGEQPDLGVQVPSAVLNELLVALTLAPLLTASLDRHLFPSSLQQMLRPGLALESAFVKVLEQKQLKFVVWLNDAEISCASHS